MSKFDNDKVMPRYMAIALVLTLVGIAVIGKAFYIMTAQKQYWTEVAGRLKRDSVVVKPNRGNILSSEICLELRTFADINTHFFKLQGKHIYHLSDRICSEQCVYKLSLHRPKPFRKSRCKAVNHLCLSSYHLIEVLHID